MKYHTKTVYKNYLPVQDKTVDKAIEMGEGLIVTGAINIEISFEKLKTPDKVGGPFEDKWGRDDYYLNYYKLNLPRKTRKKEIEINPNQTLLF